MARRDPEWERKKEAVKKHIDERLDDQAYDRSDAQDVAREVSDKYGVALTEREVRDIHRSGF